MTLLEDIPTHAVTSLTFSTYSSDEIRRLSVKQVTSSQSFDNLGHPISSGLHDPAFGAIDLRDVCHTCGLGSQHCPGHMGHIELPLSVFNPVYFKIMLNILKRSCFQCQHFNVPYVPRCQIIAQVDLLEHGLLAELSDVQNQLSILMQELATDTITEMDVGVQLAEFTANLIQNKSAAFRAQVITKNILELKRQLIQDFLKVNSQKRKCIYCQTRIPNVRADNNATVCLYNVAQKIQQQQQQQANSDSSKQQKDDDDMEVKEDDDVHDEMPDDLELIADVADKEEDKPVSKKKKSVKETTQETMIDQVYLSPVDCREHIRQLWKNDPHLLKVLFGAVELDSESHGNIFFLDVISVPPPRFRPAACLGGAKFENAQTSLLSRVTTSADVIRQVLFVISKNKDSTTTLPADTLTMPIAHLYGESLREKLHSAWTRLQCAVNCLLDQNLDANTSEKKFSGIKQILEKKEGLFRKHMMGKRVDFAARSVISPDPSIKTNEVGLPEVFAKKLTFPEFVTPWNVESLMEAVINGPAIHPGAVSVVDENGFKQHLSATDTVQREAVAKRLLTPDTNPANRRTYFGCKQVYRHIKNGDVMLLNRQPTLHRPSIQAHMARVLPGERTIRLHYANCNAYNADFDGDEMNAHFPQGQIARAEAYTIAATHKQYLVPKDGTPLAGLIQDHMIAGVSLTIRGRSFTRTDYQQLVFCALSEKRTRIKLLPASIIKPCRLWSGKQVISTLLINLIPEGKTLLSLIGKSKISEKNWQTGHHRTGFKSLNLDQLGESHVVIHNGELLCGVLDKGHYGPTPGGLVHSCYELYGGEVAGQLLTSLARLFTAFLQMRGFTLGVQDILVTDKANTVRHDLMEVCSTSGRDAAQEAFGLDENADDSEITMAFQQAQFSQGSEKMCDLDLCMKSRTDDIQNQITKACMPQGLIKLFPHNNMQLMAQSGAKGSMVNTMQISCLLGQIELEGRRPPMMVSGSSLPSFLPYDVSPRAGGFVDGRFLTGINPQEYFFHCMAGREGLVDTAVKTSRSGYLQRCIIKHMEGLVVSYDSTVRDSDSSIIQFYYGEDGLDISKVQFLTDKQLSFIHENKDAFSQAQVAKHFTQSYHTKAYKRIEHWKKRNPDINVDSCRTRHSGFLKFCSKQYEDLTSRDDYGIIVKNGRTKMSEIFTKEWYSLDESARNRYNRGHGPCPDPVLSYKTPYSQLGILSEEMMERVNRFCSGHRHQDNFDENEFRNFIYMKCMQSFVEPGEAVGLLAAQSIGEPSTQMTLNTFHFAGRGEMNVTLGIPRLREILMSASKSIKTPAMDIPVHNTSKARRRAKALQNRLNKVQLNEVLQSVEVHERLEVKSKTLSARIYRLVFNFLPYEAYSNQFAISPPNVLQYMEKFYFKRLCTLIKKKMAYIAKTELLNSGSVKSTVARARPSDEGAAEAIGPVNDDSEQSDADVNDDKDDDMTSTKLMARHQDDAHDYHGEDDEGEDVDDDNSDAELSGAEDDGGDAEINHETNTSEQNVNQPVKIASKLKVKLKKARRSSEGAVTSRCNFVAGLHPNIIDYTYDVTEELWCQIQIKYMLQESKLDLISLIKADAPQAVIFQTNGISRAFLTEEKGLTSEPQTHLKTEGINVMEMYKYDKILNLNRLYSNDVHQMAAVYGIEAASKVIIQEIKSVFAAYGINVDYRHLSLIADYMTFEGSYKAFNRFALTSNSSPLQKMTFETTVNFLRTCALEGGRDDLLSPSARLVTGRVVQCGTGGFELLYAL